MVMSVRRFNLVIFCAGICLGMAGVAIAQEVVPSWEESQTEGLPVDLKFAGNIPAEPEQLVCNGSKEQLNQCTREVLSIEDAEEILLIEDVDEILSTEDAVEEILTVEEKPAQESGEDVKLLSRQKDFPKIITRVYSAQSRNDYAKGMEAYNRKHRSKAIKLLSASGQGGYVKAQLQLGDMYDAGDLVTKNLQKAFAWYTRAAMQGDSVGEYKVGMMTLRGRGTKRDANLAASWLKKSAEQGNARAQTNYGSLHLTGSGVEVDYTEAVRWFQKAAEQNYGDAQFLMGVACEYGEGIEQNMDQAIAWYEKAADNGSSAAKGPLFRLKRR
jgi:TPR repeat protein